MTTEQKMIWKLGHICSSQIITYFVKLRRILMNIQCKTFKFHEKSVSQLGTSSFFFVVSKYNSKITLN